MATIYQKAVVLEAYAELVQESDSCWMIQYKTNETESWQTLKEYHDRESALACAWRAAKKYYLIKVIDAEGAVIWCN